MALPLIFLALTWLDDNPDELKYVKLMVLSL